MKIALDAYHAHRAYGGIARYLRGLVPALAAAARSDQFVLFSNRFRDRDASWDPGLPNVSCYDLVCPRRLMQGCWDHLAWPPVESFIGPIDLFHGAHFVLPAARRAKLVLTVHDLTYLRHPDYFSDRALNERGYRVELPRALARADAVIADSSQTKADLVELLGCPEERIMVVYPGVDTRFFVAADEARLAEVKARYHLERPYLVFLVGSPEPRKNLVRAVTAARQAAPDMPLVIVGPQEPIRTLLGGETQGMILLGSLSDEDLPLVLHGAEAALYPSLYEGFGFPAVEALAAGVPLITSNRSSLPEVVGKAALLVDPESVEAMAEAIHNLLRDAEQRKQYIALGLARARELSWEETARQVLQLYHEVA